MSETQPGWIGCSNPLDEVGGAAPEKCERCTREQEGYCEQLQEFLCQECLVLELQSAIETAIAERIDDVAAIEKAFEDAAFRTDSDEVYTSVDFDIDGVSHSVALDELFGAYKGVIVKYGAFIGEQYHARVTVDGVSMSGFGATRQEARENIVPWFAASLEEQSKALEKLKQLWDYDISTANTEK